MLAFIQSEVELMGQALEKIVKTKESEAEALKNELETIESKFNLKAKEQLNTIENKNIKIKVIF